MTNKFFFSIDRGGTFTDVYSKLPNGKSRIIKLLSSNPSCYENAPFEAIRRIISEYNGMHLSQVPSDLIEEIRMGTTIATNALLERKGEDCVFVVTKNFEDILKIGSQTRPNLFDIKCEKPSLLYKSVIEIDERIVLDLEDDFYPDHDRIKCENGQNVICLKAPCKTKIHEQLLNAHKKGHNSVAICLVNSYIYDKHETFIANIAREIGFKNVTISSEIMKSIKFVPRAFNCVTDAYLTPCLVDYIVDFTKGFDDYSSIYKKIKFMQSDGGLCSVENFIGSRAVLSGPAGGVMALYKTFDQLSPKGLSLIGFDMGGTSTDVCRFGNQLEHVFETNIAGVELTTPQLDISTVAAGGGSRLEFVSGIFHVGPESVGSHPGPVCYGIRDSVDNLAVTDANLTLGRILPQYFPSIFGPNQNESLFVDNTLARMKEITEQINLWNGQQHQGSSIMSVQEVALGFIEVANEIMCRKIRTITQARGYDTSNHILVCFGGAGGQHACSIAQKLNISQVIVHKHSSILSAYGIALSDVVHEEQSYFGQTLSQDNLSNLHKQIIDKCHKCYDHLNAASFEKGSIKLHVFLNVRYQGTDYKVSCPSAYNSEEEKNYFKSYQERFSVEVKSFEAFDECWGGSFKKTLSEKYAKEMGFRIVDRNVIVEDIRIRGIGVSKIALDLIKQAKEQDSPCVKPKEITPTQVCKVFFREGLLETRVYPIENLSADHKLTGPCILYDTNTTILVEPNCTASLTKTGDVILNIAKSKNTIANRGDIRVDPIHLSIFSNRFMSIAEQMGFVLKNTSVSTNIKERLDFSCALFSADGGLVANAPHIPVHLGAMQRAVEHQIIIRSKFERNEAILCNYPDYGGSHLPDLTVITPIFHEDRDEIIFFMANRGHHADIGGLTPGSMPAFSQYLWQEGAIFKSFQLVKDGVFQEENLKMELMKPGQYPGCSGTRNLNDNINDLKAQLAANQRGASLLFDLIHEYSLDVVLCYMQYIKENAEFAVRDSLKRLALNPLSDEIVNSSSFKSMDDLKTLKADLDQVREFSFQDYLDDGSTIRLHVSINTKDGTSTFDFTGTSENVIGNFNSPSAILTSCIIYSLRLLVEKDIPLNQGCLNPIKVIVPEKSIIRPTEGLAVVGGNVMTSQRIVDVILGAFGVVAASHGCMNSLTFGNEKIGGYYETICGGSGAGPGWNGADAVHVHMTNTRITDVEIMESRHMVVVDEFSLRKVDPVLRNHFDPFKLTGNGLGKWNGGKGVVRRLIFRQPMTACLLTQRRVIPPYGLFGGELGQRGENYLIRSATEDKIRLSGISQVDISPGDSIEIRTAGGGGYGKRIQV